MVTTGRSRSWSWGHTVVFLSPPSPSSFSFSSLSPFPRPLPSFTYPPVSEMTCTVSSGTLNPSISYHTYLPLVQLEGLGERCKLPSGVCQRKFLVKLTSKNASGDNRFSLVNPISMICTINCPISISPCKICSRLGSSSVDRPDGGMAGLVPRICQWWFTKRKS